MNIRSWLIQIARPYLRKHPALKRKFAEAELRIGLWRHTAARSLPILIQPEVRNLTVAITANCNLRCVGCRYGRDFMTAQQLPWPVMKDLLDDARSLGVQLVRLYGGEPLLHRDLAQIIRYAVGLGLNVYVTTNGILLKDKIDELYAAGLRSLTVGFYGTGRHYDAYVQRPERYTQLEASVDYVRRRYGDGVSLSMNWLLMRPNCNVEALHQAWDFGLRYRMPIQVDLIHYSLPYFSEGPDRELHFRPEDRPRIEVVVAELERLKRSHPEMLQQSLVALRSIPEWLLQGPGMRVPCDKYQMLWVGPDGTVQMCYVTFRLGNLHETRLRSLVYTAAHRQAARDAFALNCPNCHCGYDSRIQKHAASRAAYGA